MSLFSVLYSSSNGMLAQTQNTQYISQNIANVTTTGYKEIDGAFQSLVYNTSRYGVQDDGGGSAQVNRIQRVSKQGAIQQSASATDTAINGNGFFATKSTIADENFSYTRNGSFGEDATGLLRNAAGFILYGAQVTDSQNAPDVSTSDNLIPINVTAFDESSIPTQFFELPMNLNASEEVINPQTLTTPQTLPLSNLAATETRTFNIVDNLGVERPVRFEFRKIVGPMANFTTQFGSDVELSDPFVDINGPTTGIADNDAFTITVGGVTETFEFVDTAGSALTLGANEIIDMEALLNTIDNFNGGGVLQADFTAEGQLLVRATDPTATVALSEVSGSPLSTVSALNIAPDAGAESAAPDYIFEPEADITATSTTYPDQGLFPGIDNTANPNPSHWWEVTVATDVTTGAGIAPTSLATGLINFNGDGTLNTPRDAFGNPTNGTIDLSALAIDFDTTVTGEESGFVIDISRTSQFSSPTQVIFSEHDGAPIGQRTGINITRDGYVSASYSNGQVLNLYRVPLVTFVAQDQLTDRSGTIFLENQNSGIPTFQGVGEGSAGFFQESSLEQSTVDIADEFSGLIVSQRAYSLNSQVLQAANEMTQGLSRLIS